VLAAAATLWMLFSVWLICPHVGVRPQLSRIVGAALGAELVMLLVWSYGTEACDANACAPLAQAAGVAATLDLPVLSVLLVAVVLRTTTTRRASGPSDVPEVSRRG
jgi:hypothetical protein